MNKLNLKSIFNLNEDLYIESISIDSRQKNLNGAFFCMSGISTDGHKYVDNAIKNGAKVIVYSKILTKIDGITYIKVNDVNDALIKVLNIYYDNPYDKLEVYAVTGTNGKTTTAYIIENILSNIEKTSYNGTIGTKIDGILNQYSHFTTPDIITLTKIVENVTNKKCKSLAIEVSSHALEQHRVDNIKIDVGIFTNLTHEHLDFHKTMDSYMKAKRKLFSFIKPNGYALLNIDDPYFEDIKKGCKCNVITYGYNKNADYKICNTNLSNRNTIFTLVTPNSKYTVKTNLLSKVNTYNLTAALASMELIGHDMNLLLKYTNKLCIDIGRFQQIANNDLNIYVDFAHTPDGFEKIFEFAKSITSSNNEIHCVFGSAGQRDVTKRPILGTIADKYCDKIVICEDDYRDEDPYEIAQDILKGIVNMDKVSIIIDRYKAIEHSIKNSKKGDTILILSKGLDRYIPKNGKDEYWMGDDVACKKILEEL